MESDRTAPPEAELRYLARDVLPRWSAARRASRPRRASGRRTGAPVHGDLAPHNIVVRPEGGFTAIDWEDAQPDGLALSDLVGFLLGALVFLDRRPRDGDVEVKARLLRGDSDLSGFLFAWLRRTARALELEPEAVAALVTLRILDVGSAMRTYEALDEAPAAEALPEERLAELWLSDPLLGPDWDRWRA